MTEYRWNGRNAVWIELTRPHDNEHGHELARLASSMLRKLGDPGGLRWDEERQLFCKVGGVPGSHATDADPRLTRRGYWMNLEYLASDNLLDETGVKHPRPEAPFW